MTKQKSTKRALLLSALSLLMCVSMLIGSTFAWFTDSVTSGNNKIIAGNLDVELYHSDKTATDEKVSDTTKLFDDVTLWEPGAMVWEKLTVKNLGSLALKYTLTVNVSDVSIVNGKSLADVLQVAVMTAQPTRENIVTAEKQKLETFSLNSDKVLAAKNGVDEFYVAIYWAPSANDNDYNVADEKLYANLGVTLVATQATVESDSFDDQYDMDAEYPSLIPTVKTLAELREAMANGGEYKLGADINVSSTELLYSADGGHGDGSAFILKTGKTVLDLNGHNITVTTGNKASDVFFVVGDAELTVKGDGTVTADCGIFVAYDSATTINIECGHYKCTASNDMLYAIWGKLNVSGGSYETAYWNLINIYGQGNISLVDVTGGSFKNWNPASSPDGNLLADGYTVKTEVVW